MGPLQETKRVQQHEKEISRSRIPRLILRPHLPQQKHKVSPASESPFSEEESREFDPSSSRRSARTIRSNSFCSDDTGCPSSQSVSPVKTPSDTVNSPVGFCRGSDKDFTRKKCTIGMVGEGGIQSARYKKEQKPGLVKPGSEADFSSSSSTGSISAPEVHMSAAGSKRSSFSRKRSGWYTSCGEKHGVKAPNRDQYLTPLQQKEVTVRHLKTRLKESEHRLQEREGEIVELKSQLARMREDWIEEECHRVEAQLALKEARKEIKHLKQVIETMRSSLADKDQGIQKYFVDINIQNKKLESLLQSMEMAHDGCLRDELCLDFLVDSPEKSFTPNTPLGKVDDGLSLEEPATEEGADSKLLVGDSPVDGTDLPDGMVAAITAEAGNLELAPATPGAEVLEVLSSGVGPEEARAMVGQAVQTDVVPYSPAVSGLIQRALKLQGPSPSASTSPDESGADSMESFLEPISALVVDLTPRNPNSAILLSPVETPYTTVDTGARANHPTGELEFAGPAEGGLNGIGPLSSGGTGRQYWSSSFLVDLLAVAAPAVPTVLWALGAPRGGADPICNIGALLRGCCAVALHSLRRTAVHIKT